MTNHEAPTVLVVEDEFLVRDFVADHLRDVGFNVLAVGDATEAMKIVETGTVIDAVFTDITLPGLLDGFALARWLRPRKPALPIVLTSGGHNAEKAAEICKGDPFLTKPYDLESLVSCLRNVIARCAKGEIG